VIGTAVGDGAAGAVGEAFLPPLGRVTMPRGESRTTTLREPAVAIKFRCSGCRAKLYVPTRWQGNTIDCPRCGAAAVVPPPALEKAPSAFDTKAVEASLAALAPGRQDDPFAQAPVTFTAPRDRRRQSKGSRRAAAADGAVAIPVAAARSPRRGLRSPVTLPWWAVYAYLGLLTGSGVAAFFLGFWWASKGAAGT